MILLVLVALLSFSAPAQNWVEERTFLKDGVATPRVDGLFTKPLLGKLGTFAWFQVEKGYSQTYAGATYSPKPWVQFALGAGLEEDKNPARLGGYVWMGDAKNSLLFVPEYGGSGFWWKMEANRKVSKVLGVGLITERHKGTGPRLEYKIPKTHFAIWGAPMFDRRGANALVGIRWSL